MDDPFPWATLSAIIHQKSFISPLRARDRLQPRTKNKEQGTRNKEQGTRNKEQGTRNKEQGTRNKEQGTRNKEQGTRTKNKEQGTKNNRACGLLKSKEIKMSRKSTKTCAKSTRQKLGSRLHL
jgi:hypothetical protein